MYNLLSMSHCAHMNEDCTRLWHSGEWCMGTHYAPPPLPSPSPPIDQVVFESFGSSGTGPLHGLKVVTPYVTKDQLHQKRYKAQLNETTYVYDFPELFKKVGELARVCVLVCVCWCVCAGVCVLVCVPVCVLVCVLACVCWHVCAGVCAGMCVLVCVCWHVCASVCAGVCVCWCVVCLYLCTRAYVRMCVCMCFET